jgi:hypothetical protein
VGTTGASFVILLNKNENLPQPRKQFSASALSGWGLGWAGLG